MEIPAALLAAFPPSANLLLDVTRQVLDDEQLREIAKRDYGSDMDRHFEALRLIRDQGVIPDDWTWHPQEVLQLASYDSPGDPEMQSDPGAGIRGHQMRAFACAALLRDAKRSEEATLAQCLASAKVLGTATSEAAGGFLTWAIPQITSDDRWFFALGLLIVATRLRAGRMSERSLGDAAAWVSAEEAELRGCFARGKYPSPGPFGARQRFWNPLAAELVREAAALQLDDVRADLTLIGAHFLGVAW